MQLIVKREWRACNASNLTDSTISIGTHDVERIKNPFSYPGYWIVLKGTLIGASEKSWRQWEDTE
jgi:hypothetical protein